MKKNAGAGCASVILKFIDLLLPVIDAKILFPIPSIRYASLYLQFIVFSRISAASRLVWVKGKLKHSMEA
ncbi:hypothetical protein WJ0W_003102 [Paenibacillus melissococcoides]|uniref:Uncharacterized protein n=1 Tax=Paenibacillus melissococcoides TaxID=2912268 RepID=A0ABN8U836_9BACL|nr:hypothetical protein WJ0W_003102 [Paenibacillus melissococcoides]